MELSYSSVCSHPRIERVDSNFIRCMQCGESMIYSQNISRNKTVYDFVEKNNPMLKNFDKHFSNIVEEIPIKSSDTRHKINPNYEYFSDKLGINKIRINKNPRKYSYPAKYEVLINNIKVLLDRNEIQKLLIDIKAVKIE
jgi:hypothetical protein